jgi:hypothetical protein
MIATLPAVQRNCKEARRIVCYGYKSRRQDKRIANRRHRRALNRTTRRMCADAERWYDEGFNAPSLSSWELY